MQHAPSSDRFADAVPPGTPPQASTPFLTAPRGAHQPINQALATSSSAPSPMVSEFPEGYHCNSGLTLGSRRPSHGQVPEPAAPPPGGGGGSTGLRDHAASYEPPTFGTRSPAGEKETEAKGL